MSDQHRHVIVMATMKIIMINNNNSSSGSDSSNNTSVCIEYLLLVFRHEDNAFEFFLFVFGFFLGPYLQHMKVPRLGSNWSCSCRPKPQSQQRKIQVESVTYAIAHSNAESLNHWARPGSKPTSSWILVKLLTCWVTTGTLGLCIFVSHVVCVVSNLHNIPKSFNL